MDYDSILMTADTNALDFSLMSQHGLTLPERGVALSERAYTVGADDCVVCSLVMLALALATIVYRHKRLILHHLSDFFTSKPRLNAAPVNDNASEVANVLILASISTMSLALIYFNHIAMQYPFTTALGVPYWVVGLAFAALMAFIYAKAWLHALVGWTFFDHESRHSWLVRYFSLTSLTAFVLLPVAVVDVLVPFVHEIAIWIVILLWLVYELLLFYRLNTNFIATNSAYLLYLVYFCTVELIPALILYKGLDWASVSLIVKNIL